MRFRRNIEEERLFKIVAMIGVLLIIALLIFYFITLNENLLDIMIPSLLIPPLYIYIANMMKNHFIEFQADKIILINETNKRFKKHSRNIELNITDIEAIFIPSSAALKSKFRANTIIIKKNNFEKYLVSYSIEIEQYINENLEISTVYYDNYKKALNS